MAAVTKPIALDETLQAVNDTLGEIRDALEGGGGGDYIPKVPGATAGNVPILKADGTLEDSGETIPSKTSDLINDSNFVSDENYVHTDNNYTSAEKASVGQITGIKNDLTQLSANVSDAWVSTKTYAVGDYCIDNNELYKCLVQNTNTAPTNATYWSRTSVGNEIEGTNRDLSNLHSNKQDLVAPTQSAYFNANTNRNDTSARADAIKALIHDRNLNVKSSFYVSAIRYAGGYYYNYIIFPVDNINLNVVEFAGLDIVGIEMHCFVWNSRTDTVTYIQ